MPNFDVSENIEKTTYHVRQISTLFCKLVSLILGLNCVKELRVTKVVKQIKFKRTWGELEARNYFRRQAPTKYLTKTLVFI